MHDSKADQAADNKNKMQIMYPQDNMMLLNILYLCEIHTCMPLNAQQKDPHGRIRFNCLKFNLLTPRRLTRMMFILCLLSTNLAQLNNVYESATEPFIN